MRVVMFSGRPLALAGRGALDELPDIEDGPPERLAERFVLHLVELARQALDQVGGGVLERVAVSLEIGEVVVKDLDGVRGGTGRRDNFARFGRHGGDLSRISSRGLPAPSLAGDAAAVHGGAVGTSR